MMNNRSTSLLFSDMHCSTENPVTAVPKATHEKNGQSIIINFRAKDLLQEQFDSIFKFRKKK